jgi:hypothetical protein
MATTRDEIADRLHRLANYTETRLCEMLPDLLGEGRSVAVCDLAYQGSRFIETLRSIRDGNEGGEA